MDKYETNDVENRKYFEENKAVISDFLYSYFEVSSLLADKFEIKDVTSSKFLSSIRSALNVNDILIQKVFGSKDDKKKDIYNPCKKLRNIIVHKNEKLQEMQDVVNRYDELKGYLNSMKNLLIVTEIKENNKDTKLKKSKKKK